MKKQYIIPLLIALVVPTFAAAEPQPRVKNLTEIIRSLAPIGGTVTASNYIDLDIRFRTNSAELSPIAYHQLRVLGRALLSEQLRNVYIGIYGHTDAVGTDAYNMNLSMRRAATVARYLINNFDIPPSRLEAMGFGERRLKIPTKGRSRINRRVEIRSLSIINSKPARVRDIDNNERAIDDSGKINW
jgi:outer membrane protein OmpA-like peptidoglycan-associated protein